MEMILSLYKTVRIPNSFRTFDYIPMYFSDSTHMVHSRIHRKTSIDHRYNTIWPLRRTFDGNRTLACKHDRRNMAHHNIAGFPNSAYLSPMEWTVSENYHPIRGLYDLWMTIAHNITEMQMDQTVHHHQHRRHEQCIYQIHHVHRRPYKQKTINYNRRI